jgi:hypothetical protein
MCLVARSGHLSGNLRGSILVFLVFQAFHRFGQSLHRMNLQNPVVLIGKWGQTDAGREEKKLLSDSPPITHTHVHLHSHWLICTASLLLII